MNHLQTIQTFLKVNFSVRPSSVFYMSDQVKTLLGFIENEKDGRSTKANNSQISYLTYLLKQIKRSRMVKQKEKEEFKKCSPQIMKSAN